MDDIRPAPAKYKNKQENESKEVDCKNCLADIRLKHIKQTAKTKDITKRIVRATPKRTSGATYSS